MYIYIYIPIYHRKQKTCRRIRKWFVLVFFYEKAYLKLVVKFVGKYLRWSFLFSKSVRL